MRKEKSKSKNVLLTTAPALQVLPQPQKEEIVKMLNEMIVQTEAGKVTGIVIMHTSNENQLTWTWHGLLPEHVLVLSERLKHYVLNTFLK